MNRSILIVEDDASLAGMLQMVIDTIPRVASSVVADEAAALTNASIAQPDLVILDMGLPFSQRLLTKLKAEPVTRPIPVLALRTWRQTHDDALRQGADESINTPFDIEAFLAKIERYLARERALG